MAKNINKNRLILLFFCLLFLAILIGGCTAYVTKIFVLQKTINESNKTGKEVTEISNILDETFEEWRIGISVRSIVANPYRSKIDSNMYLVSIGFRHKMDSLKLASIDDPWPSSVIKDTISINSINFIFFPIGDTKVLFLDSALTQSQRSILPMMERSLYFGELHIPEDIDSINVAFEIRLISEDGVEKAHKEYDFNMIKYENKYRSIPPGLLH